SHPEVQADLFGGVASARKTTTQYNLLFKALDGFIPEYIKAGEKYRAFRWPLRQGGETTDMIQVDLFTATPATWGLIYLIRTGSAEFSKRVVQSLARYHRPAHGGAVRNATGIRAEGWSGAGVPFWSDADKDRMPVVATPEESDVFALARMREFPAVERSWE
ncbi:MAG TPA: hypothetical protein VEJ18_08450, partial [Planctomycetota bacterium]|nr:hypothetical protein [Planctomycetota bacterium]